MTGKFASIFWRKAIEKCWQLVSSTNPFYIRSIKNVNIYFKTIWTLTSGGWAVGGLFFLASLMALKYPWYNDVNQTYDSQGLTSSCCCESSSICPSLFFWKKNRCLYKPQPRSLPIFALSHRTHLWASWFLRIFPL